MSWTKESFFRAYKKNAIHCFQTVWFNRFAVQLERKIHDYIGEISSIRRAHCNQGIYWGRMTSVITPKRNGHCPILSLSVFFILSLSLPRIFSPFFALSPLQGRERFFSLLLVIRVSVRSSHDSVGSHRMNLGVCAQCYLIPFFCSFIPSVKEELKNKQAAPGRQKVRLENRISTHTRAWRS